MNSALTPRRANNTAVIERQLETVLPLQQLSSTLKFDSLGLVDSCVQKLPAAIAAAQTAIETGELDRAKQVVAAASTPASGAEIGRHLAQLIAVFPNATRAPLKVYGELLAQDVQDAKPSMMSLALTCRRLRQTSKFLPTISEVIETLAEEEKRLSRTRYFLENFEKHLQEAQSIVLAELRRGRPMRPAGEFLSQPHQRPPQRLYGATGCGRLDGASGKS